MYVEPGENMEKFIYSSQTSFQGDIDLKVGPFRNRKAVWHNYRAVRITEPCVHVP